MSNAARKIESQDEGTTPVKVETGPSFFSTFIGAWVLAAALGVAAMYWPLAIGILSGLIAIGGAANIFRRGQLSSERTRSFMTAAVGVLGLLMAIGTTKPESPQVPVAEIVTSVAEQKPAAVDDKHSYHSGVTAMRLRTLIGPLRQERRVHGELDVIPFQAAGRNFLLCKIGAELCGIYEGTLVLREKSAEELAKPGKYNPVPGTQITKYDEDYNLLKVDGTAAAWVGDKLPQAAFNTEDVEAVKAAAARALQEHR